MPASSIPDIVAARRKPGDGSAPWSSPLASLPWDIEDILKCAAGDSAALDAAAKACGTRPVVAESACRWFIRHVLFRSGASYYWNLGVGRDAPIDLIRAHYRHLISIFHPDRLQQSDEREWYESFAKRVNEAYNTLKNGDARLKYDRLQNAGSASVVDRKADVGEDPAGFKRRGNSPDEPPRRAPRPIFTRDTWRNAPSRGAVPEWIETRRPTTLKVLAFAGVVALAIGAVALNRAHKSPQADVILPNEIVLPSSAPERDTRLADSLEKAAAPSPPTAVAPAGTLPTTGDKRLPVRAAQKLPGEATVPGVVSSNAIRLPTPMVAARAIVTGVPSAPESPASSESPKSALPVIVAATSTVESQPVAIAETAPAANQTPAPMIATAQPLHLPALTADDVDQVLARFARAYDAGDFKALAALIDPEIAHDDRMAFAMANFNRVFRETSSRQIRMRELKRSVDNEYAQVQLETQTFTVGNATGQRTDSGLLTLVVHKRGDTPVITELKYREKGAG